MATIAELQSAVQLNTGNLATLQMNVTRRIDQLRILFSTWKASIDEQKTKLEDRIETSFVQRDLQTATLFEEVVRKAEVRVQEAVQHGEQLVHKAVSHGEQQLQQVAQQLQADVKQNEERCLRKSSLSMRSRILNTNNIYMITNIVCRS